MTGGGYPMTQETPRYETYENHYSIINMNMNNWFILILMNHKNDYETVFTPVGKFWWLIIKIIVLSMERYRWKPRSVNHHGPSRSDRRSSSQQPVRVASDKRFNISHRIRMYAIYGNIYHEYTPNVSIYTIHGSYGLVLYLHILHSGIHSVVVIGGDW